MRSTPRLSNATRRSFTKLSFPAILRWFTNHWCNFVSPLCTFVWPFSS